MKESVYNKLETLVERYEEVQALLSDPSVISDQNRFRGLSKEYSELEEIVKTFLSFQQTKEDLASAEEMLKDSDPDMREMAQEEYKEAKQMNFQAIYGKIPTKYKDLEVFQKVQKSFIT